MNINKALPITITPYPNGGFIVEQAGMWPTPPGATPTPNKLGAFSSAEDLLMALGEALSPPVATLDQLMVEKELADEGWRPINTAPRDVWVKVRCEDGSSRSMKFHAPYWWTARNGAARVLDGATPDRDVDAIDIGATKATHWKPL